MLLHDSRAQLEPELAWSNRRILWFSNEYLGRFPAWNGYWKGGFFRATAAPLSTLPSLCPPNGIGDSNLPWFEDRCGCIAWSNGWAPRCTSSLSGEVHASPFWIPLNKWWWLAYMAATFWDCCIHRNTLYYFTKLACNGNTRIIERFFIGSKSHRFIGVTMQAQIIGSATPTYRMVGMAFRFWIIPLWGGLRMIIQMAICRFSLLIRTDDNPSGIILLWLKSCQKGSSFPGLLVWVCSKQHK